MSTGWCLTRGALGYSAGIGAFSWAGVMTNDVVADAAIDGMARGPR